jgi:Co/Zn/Cd efflux system component
MAEPHVIGALRNKRAELGGALRQLEQQLARERTNLAHLEAWEKFNLPVAPDPLLLSLTAVGALGVNLSCALMLTRYRYHSGSLTKAAFLSARNDAAANIAIIAAGLVTAFPWPSAWPDLIVGLGIAAMNADAAREVWHAAREEHKMAEA